MAVYLRSALGIHEIFVFDDFWSLVMEYLFLIGDFWSLVTKHRFVIGDFWSLVTILVTSVVNPAIKG